MKKFLIISLLTCTFTAQAQYLPNKGFENWKTSCGSSYQASTTIGGESANPAGLRQRPGIEPEDWNGTNVNQKVLIEAKEPNLVTKGNRGTESEPNFYAKLTNYWVGAGSIGATAPAYLTFGTPWSYAAAKDQDGGTFGGVSFTYKPDAIKGLFKRENVSGKSEKAHIIVYLWRGTSSSQIGKLGGGKVTQEDVDRAILSKPNAGTIGGDGQLIASCDHEFSTTENDDWEEIEVPIVYESNEAPTKMNVVISSADYWTRSNIVEGNKDNKLGSILNVDDVQFVYYHALTDLKYDGTTISGFDEATTPYDMSTVVYDASKLSYTVKGAGASAETSYDANTAVLTITVKGNDYEANNKSVTVYTIKFKKAPEVTSYTNSLLVNVAGGNVPAQENTVIKMIRNFEPESYSFLLEDFSLTEDLPIGDIQIDNLTRTEKDGKVSYTGKQTITILENMDVEVTVSATVTGNNMTAHIYIPVEGVGDVNVDYAPALNISSDKTLSVTQSGDYIVTLNRNFKKGWNTFALPFATTSAALGEGVKAQAFISASEAELNFNITENLEANTPYLVYFPEATVEPLYFAATVDAAATANDVAHGSYTFKCNYEADFSMNGKYGVAEIDGVQKIMLGTAGSTLLATGAYFTSDSAKANGMKINIGGQTTGIGSLTDGKSADEAVYNLQGIKVTSGSLSGLSKGVYVKNGRKVIVK